MQPSKHYGFTLFEILIVMSILAFLLLAGITNWNTQMLKAYDTQRKGDLSKLKAALEQYAYDHGCYPAVNQMTCDSVIFASYNMPNVLCDPEAKQPYLYELVNPADPCKGYRLYARIRAPRDSNVEAIGCNRDIGCGVSGHPEYNYGVSSGNSVLQ